MSTVCQLADVTGGIDHTYDCLYARVGGEARTQVRTAQSFPEERDRVD